MGRTRTLVLGRADAYKRADLEGATDRFPADEVTRYINQGRAALRDEIIKARGRSYFRKTTPHTITTTADTSRYALNSDFYQLISVRTSGDMGDSLEPFTPLDEPWLRAPGSSNAEWPSHYELQDGYIELLPLHRAGLSVIVEYIPTLTDLSADGDLIEGYNGWEDYVIDYAAMQMAMKDDEPRVVAMLERSLARMSQRIAQMAPKRDRFRAEREKDVRGTSLFARVGRWR
jgi:hypothetical protein